MKYVGYVKDELIPIRPGHTVTIKKGVLIKSTNPSRRQWIAGRTYKVKVNHLLHGITDTLNRYGRGGSLENPDPIEPPKVRWPGTGGYWCEVDLNEIPEAQ